MDKQTTKVPSNEVKRRLSIGISQPTKDMLDSIKHTGQSYDGLIRELVMHWKKKEEAEATK